MMHHHLVFKPQMLKKFTLALLTAAMLIALICLPASAAVSSTGTKVNALYAGVTPSFNPSNEGIIHIEYHGNMLKSGEQYVVMMVEGSQTKYNITQSTILYINQMPAVADAAGAAVVFDVYPSAMKSGVILLTGLIGGVPQVVPIAEVIAGVTVSGQVKGYNTGNAVTTVTLAQNGVSMYTTTIAAGTEAGETVKSFTLNGVAPGTYDLVVARDYHLTYTVTGVKVESKNIDLTAAADKAYSTIQMIAGDLDKNGLVNGDDLNIIWNAENFKKNTANAVKAESDVNCDGSVNADDLNIVWSSANFNKNTQHCIYPY